LGIDVRFCEVVSSAKNVVLQALYISKMMGVCRASPDRADASHNRSECFIEGLFPISVQ